MIMQRTLKKKLFPFQKIYLNLLDLVNLKLFHSFLKCKSKLCTQLVVIQASKSVAIEVEPSFCMVTEALGHLS